MAATHKKHKEFVRMSEQKGERKAAPKKISLNTWQDVITAFNYTSKISTSSSSRTPLAEKIAKALTGNPLFHDAIKGQVVETNPLFYTFLFQEVMPHMKHHKQRMYAIAARACAINNQHSVAISNLILINSKKENLKGRFLVLRSFLLHNPDGFSYKGSGVGKGVSGKWIPNLYQVLELFYKNDYVNLCLKDQSTQFRQQLQLVNHYAAQFLLNLSSWATPSNEPPSLEEINHLLKKVNIKNITILVEDTKKTGRDKEIDEITPTPPQRNPNPSPSFSMEDILVPNEWGVRFNTFKYLFPIFWPHHLAELLTKAVDFLDKKLWDQWIEKLRKPQQGDWRERRWWWQGLGKVFVGAVAILFKIISTIALFLFKPEELIKIYPKYKWLIRFAHIAAWISIGIALPPLFAKAGINLGLLWGSQMGMVADVFRLSSTQVFWALGLASTYSLRLGFVAAENLSCFQKPYMSLDATKIKAPHRKTTDGPSQSEQIDGGGPRTLDSSSHSNLGEDRERSMLVEEKDFLPLPSPSPNPNQTSTSTSSSSATAVKTFTFPTKNVDITPSSLADRKIAAPTDPSQGKRRPLIKSKSAEPSTPFWKSSTGSGSTLPYDSTFTVHEGEGEEERGSDEDKENNKGKTNNTNSALQKTHG